MSFAQGSNFSGPYEAKGLVNPDAEDRRKAKCGCDYKEEKFVSDDCVSQKTACEESYLKWDDDKWEKYYGKAKDDYKPAMLAICNVVPSVIGRAAAAGVFHILAILLYGV